MTMTQPDEHQGSDTEVSRASGHVRFRRLLEGVLGVPATEGNHIEILRNGVEIFPAMLSAINAAEHTVDLLTFVYWDGEIGERFASALAERARAGVRVRVLIDSWGGHPMNHEMLALMQDAGVDVQWFRPLRAWRPLRLNHRTHRKVLVVDEEVAFTGGVGIADEWDGDARNADEWRDTHLRVRGPAVDGLRAAFLDNWLEASPVFYDERVDRFPEQPQPGSSTVLCVRGAAEVGQSDVATLFHALIQAARHRIRIATAYFVPDEEMIQLLCDAAARGVEVQILLPGDHADKRFVQLASEHAYESLLECGVGVWAFQPSMLHAKIMTVDGEVANLGSANVNRRSTQCDEEINLVALDRDIVARLDEQFEEDLDRSLRIRHGRWNRRPWRQRIQEAVVLPIRSFF